MIQSEDIGSQLLSLFSGKGERLIVVIHAFIDESGTDQRAPVVAVAAFYGTQDQWSKFREIWKLTPSYKTFHALKCSSMFPRLCDAIEESRISGLLVTIGKNTYRQHAGEHFKSAVGNCYALSAFMCAMHVHREVGKQPISVVLEQGQPNLSFVKRVLEGMIEAGEHGLAAVASARKSDFIELHAADFISHAGSTHDVEWHFTKEVIAKTSPQIKAMFSRARNARKAARRKNEI